MVAQSIWLFTRNSRRYPELEHFYVAVVKVLAICPRCSLLRSKGISAIHTDDIWARRDKTAASCGTFFPGVVPSSSTGTFGLYGRVEIHSAREIRKIESKLGYLMRFT